MSYFLGTFGYGPNPAAAILKDGEIIAFAEEERFNRIKTAPTSLPFAAIIYCLEEAGITIEDVSGVGFGWQCEDYIQTMPGFYESMDREFPDNDTAYNNTVRERLLINYHPERIRQDLCRGLAGRGHRLDATKIHFLRHHHCHATSAFYCSGFDEATVVTLDGSGEESTCVIWHGKDGNLEEIRRFELPHSLGGCYATFTEFLGFRPYQDEGKLMGLAAYGQPSEELNKKLNEVLAFDPANGNFTVNPYMRHLDQRSYGQNFTDRLVDLFGSPRRAGEDFKKRDYDLAFAVQNRLEAIALALTRSSIEQTGSRNVCIAGGVAMNCKLNGKIALMNEVDDIFVQPASADNGVALGAAYILAHEVGVNTFMPMTHAYWGPGFSHEETEKALIDAKLEYYKPENLSEEIAEYIENGKIVGWFQGRMEVGSRALGGRSILANPLIPDMRNIVNAKVKHREEWRPFCPSMTAEAYKIYFGDVADSPYMILAFPVKPEYHDLIPSVVHVDGTARPQVVTYEHNPAYHDLISEFGRRTGHSILLNTSFNVQGEPVVCTPRDALRCFGGTGIDILVMNEFVTRKPDL